MIYLGTGFTKVGWNNGHDTFEFNDKVFQRTPTEFVKDMHEMKMHVALHIVPQAASDSRVLYRSLHGSIPVAAGEEVDGTHIAPYWRRHKELFDAGVDGWWPDEGDWLDVPSRLARHRMYYEGPLADRPNVRPWDLQRNGYIGISRWGGWVWSGDVSSSWNTLAEHVKIGQNSCLSVSPFWGSDIGGFYPARTKEYTGELYLRWFQFAAFCPSFRSHGRTWHLHTPWGWNTGEYGPIENNQNVLRSELHNAEATLDDLAYYRTNFNEIVTTREKLSRQLTLLGFRVLPSQTNFILAKPPLFPADFSFFGVRFARPLI
jgi:alpha-glucosidase/alpha-D-xyloside xylohydrolase